MLPSFLGIVAQGGGGPPPPPVGVLISAQTLNVSYLTTTPAESFTFSGAATYLTNGASVTSFSYQLDPTTAFALDLTGLTAMTYAGVAENPSMITPPNFTGCTALTTIEVVGNDAMTTASDLSNLTNLTYANFNNNLLMATAPNFTGCTALAAAYVSGCSISDSNLLTMCGQIYASAPAGGTLSMEGGFNGSFDGQSLPTEITDLQGNGWTVTFNDNNPP